MLLKAVDEEQWSMYDAMREAWLEVYEPEERNPATAS
jgi:hypothetical protein